MGHSDSDLEIMSPVPKRKQMQSHCFTGAALAIKEIAMLQKSILLQRGFVEAELENDSLNKSS